MRVLKRDVIVKPERRQPDESAAREPERVPGAIAAPDEHQQADSAGRCDEERAVCEPVRARGDPPPDERAPAPIRALGGLGRPDGQDRQQEPPGGRISGSGGRFRAQDAGGG